MGGVVVLGNHNVSDYIHPQMEGRCSQQPTFFILVHHNYLLYLVNQDAPYF
jgi:hypothetical protein